MPPVGMTPPQQPQLSVADQTVMGALTVRGDLTGRGEQTVTAAQTVWDVLIGCAHWSVPEAAPSAPLKAAQSGMHAPEWAH